MKGILQVLPGAAAVRRQDRAETAVHAPHPALGLRMAGRDQAMLAVLFGAAPVEDLLTRGVTLASGATTVGERLALVVEDLGDLEGGGLQEVRQEALGASSRLSGDPRRGFSPLGDSGRPPVSRRLPQRRGTPTPLGRGTADSSFRAHNLTGLDS